MKISRHIGYLLLLLIIVTSVIQTESISANIDQQNQTTTHTCTQECLNGWIKLNQEYPDYIEAYEQIIQASWQLNLLNETDKYYRLAQEKFPNHPQIKALEIYLN